MARDPSTAQTQKQPGSEPGKTRQHTTVASREIKLPEAISVFKTFADSSPRSGYWYAFLNWRSGHGRPWQIPSPLGEGLYYLEASLRYRIGSTRAVTEVLAWLRQLRREPDSDICRAEEVHGNIVMSAFGIKSRLMQDFEREIQEFDQQICAGNRELNLDRSSDLPQRGATLESTE